MGRTARVRREDVLKAARAGFLEGGYAGTTLAQIAARVGVSPAALLRHAPTKQALFDQAMGFAPERDLYPLSFLDATPGTADPMKILRRVGETFVPFIRQRLREVVAMYLHTRGQMGSIPLPYDPAQRPTPPQKAVGSLSKYLRRAHVAGRVRVDDPYATAAAFLGALHSFVFLSDVVGAFDRPFPFERYLDTLLAVWERGVVTTRRRSE